VTSSDGIDCPINVQIGKRTFFGRTSLNQVCDQRRIDRDRIDELLGWTPDQLREWLRQYPAEILKSRAQERRWIQWRDEQERTHR